MIRSTENLELPGGNDLVALLLEEQQTLTAVQRFSQVHSEAESPSGAKLYRDLIPSSLPSAGEQFAFEVDLDACSGCKACVAACHNLNGLESDELWRNVGQLVGGTTRLPVIQHVTTACHHCVEPACLHGCPVEAYEKDPLTGIVRHLDDQCIGCQYCMLKCPYDVPVYSKSKGIVRKCDMCSQRLAANEAPACVQSCPNQAIRIQVVNQELVREDSEVDPFLPGAPEPGYTLPTTSYKTDRVLPRNTLPSDYFSVRSGHGHLPLVFMLVLTQMSVGAFVIEYAIDGYFAMLREAVTQAVRPWHLCGALLLGFLGLGAAIFHLGRPFYAYRALLGLRTSWLSREILAFNAFAGAATLYVGSALLHWWGVGVPEVLQSLLGGSASLAGLLAVFCSVMIYVDTRRPLWSPGRTTIDFLLTGLVLGLPMSLLVSLLAAAVTDVSMLSEVQLALGGTFCQALMGAVVVKLLVELSLLTRLWDRHFTPHRRAALLLTGELSRLTLRRCLFAVIGGIVLPSLFLVQWPEGSLASQSWFSIVAAMLSVGFLTAGELVSRYLFFAASVSARMPGSPD